MSSMPTADLYLRLSDFRADGTFGGREDRLTALAKAEEDFEGRKRKLTALAVQLGWPVHRVVVENDMMRGANGEMRPASAFKRRKVRTPSGRVEMRVVRPGFREILDDIITGRANGLIAEDLDRVVRDPRDLEDLLDACEATGASARSLSGSLTLTNGGTDAERMTARMMVSMANKSSRDTSRRVAEARERHHGTSYGGGPRPYGLIASQETMKHHRTLLIVPDEAEVIREMAADILDKDLSLMSVARGLRERGIPTLHGGEWCARSVKLVLTKPSVAGLAVLRGNLKEGTWPAILDRDVWERLVEKLNNRAGDRLGTSNEPRHLVSCLALCGSCSDGTTVRATGRADDTFYACLKGYHLKRRTKFVDPYISGLVVARLSKPDVRNILRPPVRTGIDVSSLRAEARRLRDRKTSQMRMHADGLIDDDDLAAGMRTIRDRLGVVNSQLAASDERDPLEEFRDNPASAVWEKLPLARKREVIRLLMDITIMPAAVRGRSSFDPDSVAIRRKV